MSTLEALLGAIRSVLAWTWAAVALPPLTVLSLLALPFDRQQRMHDWASTLWMRGVLFLAGFRLRFEGLENVKREERYVIAANHQSLADVLCVLSAVQPLTPVRFAAKRSLFFVPVLGFAMWAFGHVAIDRARARGILAGLKRAVKQRASFVFFPEGTRSDDGAMRPFKRGAFWLALRTGVDVLPITITGGVEAFPRGRWFMRNRPEVRLCVHPPIRTEGMRDDAVTATGLARRTWETIAAGLPDDARVRSVASDDSAR